MSKLPMNNSMKAIYGSEYDEDVSNRPTLETYKLELWTVSPEGKGMIIESSTKTNKQLLSIFNTWITNGWISQDDLSDFELEAIENNEELPETTLFLYNL